MDRPDAVAMLSAAKQAHRRTRSARQGFWFPLVLFGAIVLLAAPLYRAPAGGGDLFYRSVPALFPRPLAPISYFAGGYFLRSPQAVSLFWLISLPLGYVGTVIYYRLRARRRGIASPVRSYVLAGMALLAFLLLISWFGPALPGHLGDLFVRGLTPLLTIAAGLFVLAWAERSVSLAIFSLGFFALALGATLYDYANAFARIGVGVPEAAINVLIPGIVLVAAGAGFWAARGRAG